MIGTSHAILHAALCAPALHAGPQTSIALRVRLYDIRSNLKLDRTFAVDRGDGDDPKVVESDVPPATYRLDLTAPKYGCRATDYLAFLPDHTRSIAETLAVAPVLPQPMILYGGSPQSFLYVRPTFVLLDKAASACNAPIGQTLPMRVDVENDQDAYYAWLYPDPSAAGREGQLALPAQMPPHPPVPLRSSPGAV